MRRVLAAFAAVLGLLGTAPAALAAGTPPWKAGAQVGERLFDAQSALLLDERGASEEVARARSAYSGALAAGLRDADPAAHAAVLAGLRAFAVSPALTAS